MPTADKTVSPKSKKNKTKKNLIFLVLLIILIAIALFFLKRLKLTEETPVLDDTQQEEIVYVEDDSLWNPDAIIEDENHTLEMKFGF